LRRGHGYCDQIAHVFATLGYFAGYKTRLFMLKNPATQISTHTIAQVWLDNQWRFVEPYLGIVPLTSQRQLVSWDDLQREPEVLINPHQQAEAPLSLEDFREGMPFYTFPYIGVGGTLKKVFRRRAVKNTVAVTAAAHEKPPARLKDQTLDQWTVRYDEARRL